MASLVILLIFSLIQCLSGDVEGKEDQILAENIPVPSSPVPIATIDLVQSQSAPGSPTSPLQAAVLPVRKTKHQEDQEDVTRPAWVLSGAPWVTIAFAVVQIREMMKMKKDHPAENQPLQAPNDQAPAAYEAVSALHGNQTDDQQTSASETPPDSTHPDSNSDQTHPDSDEEDLKETDTQPHASCPE